MVRIYIMPIKGYKAYTIGTMPCRFKSENAWMVICNDLSFVSSTSCLDLPVSLALMDALTAAFVAYPMLPQTAWVQWLAPEGRRVPRTPNWAVPVSLLRRSLGLRDDERR
jgi:hypothetical protein